MNLFIAGTDFACALISIVILCAILSTKEQKKQKNRPLIWGIIFLGFFSAADGVSFIMDDFKCYMGIDLYDDNELRNLINLRIDLLLGEVKS